MNKKHKHNLQMEEFIQGRQKLYNALGKRKSALMNLIDALSSNQDANTVVELSLNPLFKHQYHSVYSGIQNFVKQNNRAGENQDTDELDKIILDSIPKDNKRTYHLFGIDTTPNPRQFSHTLSDKTFIYQPNNIKGNKPINIGHCYSWLFYLPQKENTFDSPWVIPLSVERVKRF